MPLAELSRTSGMSLRTLSRWKAALAADGAAGLDRRPRRDRGARRTDPRLVRQIEDLALTKPLASTATIHRVVAGTAAHLGCPAPSYSTVRDIVNALDPGLVTLALEGPTSYLDKYDWPCAARPSDPTRCGSAHLGYKPSVRSSGVYPIPQHQSRP